jgi:hypothetical protein
LILDDSDWTLSGADAIYNTPMNLAAAATGSVDITLRVDGSLTGTISNWAEISSDDGDDRDSTADIANG